MAFSIAHGPASIAQTLYGTVVGLVEDGSGGAIADAKLTITNKGTGLSLEATTAGSLLVAPGSLAASC